MKPAEEIQKLVDELDIRQARKIARLEIERNWKEPKTVIFTATEEWYKACDRARFECSQRESLIVPLELARHKWFLCLTRREQTALHAAIRWAVVAERVQGKIDKETYDILAGSWNQVMCPWKDQPEWVSA
jgi:hypothetical protein